MWDATIPYKARIFRTCCKVKQIMPPLRNTFQNLRKFLITLIFFVYVGLLVKYWPVLYNAIAEKYFAIILILLLSAVYFLLQAFNFLQLLNLKPSFLFYMETVQLWGLASLTNYLAPFQPGLALRVAHFKANRIPIANTAHTTLQQLQLSYWTGFICLGVTLIFHDLDSYRIAGITLSVVAILWFLLLKVANRAFKRFIVLFKLEKYNENLISYDLSIPGISRLIIFFIQHLISMLAVLIAFRSFGTDLSIADAFIIGIVVTLSTLLSVLPNNLGIQELLFAYSAHLNGMVTGESISIALVFRIAQILSSFLIFTFSSVIIRVLGSNKIDLSSAQ